MERKGKTTCWMALVKRKSLLDLSEHNFKYYTQVLQDLGEKGMRVTIAFRTQEMCSQEQVQRWLPKSAFLTRHSDLYKGGKSLLQTAKKLVKDKSTVQHETVGEAPERRQQIDRSATIEEQLKQKLEQDLLEKERAARKRARPEDKPTVVKSSESTEEATWSTGDSGDEEESEAFSPKKKKAKREPFPESWKSAIQEAIQEGFREALLKQAQLQKQQQEAQKAQNAVIEQGGPLLKPRTVAHFVYQKSGNPPDVGRPKNGGLPLGKETPKTEIFQKS